MPIICIKTLPSSNEINIPEVLKKICVEVSKVINCDENNIWSTWEFIQPNYYAVGRQTSSYQTFNTHSPIVRIISFEGKEQKIIEGMMKLVAKILSDEIGIDIANIFIEYSQANSGQIFDGGNIVYKK